MQGLLELVQAEQKIYNVVFHELIRQVSVECAERGQLLAKLRCFFICIIYIYPLRIQRCLIELKRHFRVNVVVIPVS